jgi:hypothetical protein
MIKGRYDMRQYEFDPFATNSDNFITGEEHQLTTINSRSYAFIVPEYAPFFVDGFKLHHRDPHGNITELNPDVDYSLAAYYVGGSRGVGKNMYGAVTLKRADMSGTILVDYHTLGGKWVADNNHVVGILGLKLYNPRTVTWDQLTNVQETFPPLAHTQELSSLLGLESLVEGIGGITNAILNRAAESPRRIEIVHYNTPNGELPKITEDDLLNLNPSVRFADFSQLLQLLTNLGLMEANRKIQELTDEVERLKQIIEGL